MLYADDDGRKSARKFNLENNNKKNRRNKDRQNDDSYIKRKQSLELRSRREMTKEEELWEDWENNEDY